MVQYSNFQNITLQKIQMKNLPSMNLKTEKRNSMTRHTPNLSLEMFSLGLKDMAKTLNQGLKDHGHALGEELGKGVARGGGQLGSAVGKGIERGLTKVSHSIMASTSLMCITSILIFVFLLRR